MSSKRYTEEFKIEAVRQVIDRGYSEAEVAQRLGRILDQLTRVIGINIRGSPIGQYHPSVSINR